MLKQWTLPYFAADDDGGRASDDDDDGGQVTSDDIQLRLGSDVAELRRALAKAENKLFRLREKNRTLTLRVTDLEAKAPGDGMTVLAAADAQALEAYRALGEPATIKASLDAAQQAASDLAALRRQETIRAAADAHGYKVGGLAKLPSLAGKDIELRDIQEDGQTVKRAFVGDQPLPDYIQANDPEFLPALTAEPPKPNGTHFVQQSGGKLPAGDLTERHIQQQAERRKAQVNPLMKQGV
jgi:hypothetical protein